MTWCGARGGRRLLWSTGLGTALALGCASPGPPRPPSLHLPEPAAKLETKRVGDEVRLTWVTSSKTTDGDTVHGMMTAVLCREDRGNAGAGKPASPCEVVKRMTVAPGSASIMDVLPHGLGSGAVTLLAYRIELLNEKGRSAGRSDPVYAAGGEAPAPAEEVTVSARRGAALIQWLRQPGGSPQENTMEVRRTPANLTGTAQQIAAERAVSAGGTAHPAPRAVKVPAHTAPGASKEQAGEVILTTEAQDEGSSSQADPRGMLDTTVRDGASYIYVAQRVRRVVLQGHDLEVRGVASAAVAFTYRDTFPPRVPSGLISVRGGGFGGTPSIDLSWEPNGESDLLGYNVYRRTGSGAFVRLNAEPVPSSAFRDLQVSPGQEYTYRVTAIDQRGNESAPGSEIHETLRQ